MVDGGIVVREVSRRNCNFAVDVGDAPSYLLKQGFGPEGAATVAHEAAVYEKLSVTGGAMDAYLPRFCGYDVGERVLILELIRGAEDLGAYHWRRRRFSTTLASAVGDALGRLHGEALPEADAMFSGRPPWVLSIHRPELSFFREASAASLELVKAVQSVSLARPAPRRAPPGLAAERAHSSRPQMGQSPGVPRGRVVPAGAEGDRLGSGVPR